MSNRHLRITIIYMLMFGLCTFGLGRTIGVDQQTKKYEELKAINNNLYHVIQDKDKSYYELEQMMIEYRWKSESCYQQMGDMQDDPDVNNDGVVNSLDLLVLQQYILNN